MRYAERMRAFGEWTLNNHLSATARLLYMRILWMFARKGEPEQLAVGNSLLMEMEGLSWETFRRARAALEDAGLIGVVSKKGNTPVYALLTPEECSEECPEECSVECSEECPEECSVEYPEECSVECSEECSEECSVECSVECSEECPVECPVECSRGQRAGAHARDVYSVDNINNNIYSLSSLSPVTPEDRGVQGRKGTEREIPTQAEVQEFARAAGISVDVRQFMLVNGANGWTDGNGKPIRNWRIWLLGYAARSAKPQTPAERRPHALNFHQREYKQGELDYLFDRMKKYDEEEWRDEGRACEGV